MSYMKNLSANSVLALLTILHELQLLSQAWQTPLVSR